ncbi:MULTISPECIES: HD-GYP domain-containing protein [unclassified Colwellia]|jgi:HD-GYP domain-containing protein (c-di-GMP phosphodiesterase class II)|uniref:HD-GYP domain-containing protein n=1 Tax=unclassified Colwellia TaxID=196834 RepID=UPI0015F65AFE|nr:MULTISPECIES: HD-GYP domain-containing protein [unclassified Colwellia]MBA6348478.1 HD-GYP domain-containing protein [Colwellia sp. BRX8-9]MBA6369848.1 HD-GYP domain-containing protein [Colwellia sp. BRX8-4]MBA6378747.1 HD-GYP domain-containing protein [Colwellia sp. BRX10-7]MBA6382681.1 HD-GYP domain-containing protein [Colwellia sp. BRX10-9]MBA6387398.1 HD-GYP domain-containing protein [Colwellia sp. BRX10-2]|tara:strand:+ start:4037 stop:5227 length:1191 start_codon:yes stop_codon:yes gene_type:complete
MIVEIEISGLLKGHYVVDIAKQRGAYSLTTPGHIKNIKVIGNLRSRGVESLLIDTSKTLTFDADNNIVGRIKETPLPASNKSPIILEISKAKKLFNQSKEIQRQVFSDAQQGRNINLTPVIEITNKTIDTVFKNADALACVINIRKKDEYLLEHSVSVSVLMTIFARFLKIDKKIIQLLSVGAFLHDVGKINIPDSILNKPGKLTEAEFTIMKSHVNHSIKIIESTPGISELSLEVAALHHEKLDGTGYPYNIPKEKITKYGRMIAICDIFDALTANRCYKEGYSHIKAFSILRSLAQKEHLDQRLVDLFIKCMGIYPVGSLVELSSNKLAIVESRNDGDPINPNVRSFYNSLDGRYVMAEDINLSDNEDFIVRGVRADDFDLDMNKIIEFLLMEG